jgi:hypothetical protein
MNQKKSEKNIKYIGGRWLKKPFDYLAIRYKDVWLHFKRVGLERMDLQDLKLTIAYAEFSKEELEELIDTCKMLINAIPTKEEIESGLM